MDANCNSGKCSTGAAALALAFKTKNGKLKALALPSSLSAFLGITEPVIFGVNLRYFKCFISGCIGGAVGGLVAGIAGVGASAYGITGVFGYLITTDYIVSYTLVIASAMAVSFALSWFLFKEDELETVPAQEKKEEHRENLKPISENIEKKEVIKLEKNAVYSPLNGNAIPLSEVKDETFAGEVLGKGMAVIPKEGKVYAPFDGVAETVFDTKHAIGLTSQDGIEVLIHIGINTVELNGRHYETHISEGDEVKAGQLLVTFDPEAIRQEGYDITTPIIVTNSDDYEEIKTEKLGDIHVMEKAITVR